MPYTNKSGETKPGIKPIPMEWSRILSEVCGSSDVKDKRARVRAGEKDQKLLLPAICFVGRSVKTRAKRYMIPTQLVMIDIDHCKDARAAWAGIRQSLGNDWVVDNIPLAHISPSGEGLHLFSLAQEGFKERLGLMNQFMLLILVKLLLMQMVEAFLNLHLIMLVLLEKAHMPII